MALEASAYATFALTATVAFGLISVSAFILLNGLSIKLHEKMQITKLLRTQTVYALRSTEAQGMRDTPYPLYKAAMATYSVFCTVVLVLLVASYFMVTEYLNMVMSVLFVTVCLGYTGWVVFRVSTASRNFVSALQKG